MGRPASTDAIPVLDSSLGAAEQAAPPVGVVAECDIAEGISPIASPRADARALVLVRLFGESIGMLKERLPAAGLHRVTWPRRSCETSGRDWRSALPNAGCPGTGT